MVQVRGKGGGFYRYYNNKRKTCSNEFMIQRKKVEAHILQNLKEQILTAENFKYVYKNLKKEINKSLNEVHEELKQKRCQFDKTQKELQNLLNFIKAGNFLNVVSESHH